MLWSQCPYEVVMSFTRSKPCPRAVRKIGRNLNLSGTTHPTLPPIGSRQSQSESERYHPPKRTPFTSSHALSRPLSPPFLYPDLRVLNANLVWIPLLVWFGEGGIAWRGN
ncbi:hypothetical protein CFOL_v3_05460 [Cephalotus follicularis]|uniref:Uncharacterized protein n=1 Tax=Cephalotus follicularis TaxID=3775 RepID=A0A1Q3B212_CEPFO|nr:hypothetical protein CFOL_v3_05460 [Cephalotus follicularis]